MVNKLYSWIGYNKITILFIIDLNGYYNVNG